MVSVIIPTYNRADKIVGAAKSVLNQTYRNIELIIVDDGSSDDTESCVSAMKDPRVHYYRQENQGACVARNLGASKAAGEYIAFQDSDDIWHPDKLEKQIRTFEEHPEIDIVCCQTKCVRLDGSSFISMADVPDMELLPSRGPYGISTQTIVVRRKVFSSVQFDPLVTRYQDLDFMLTAMKSYRTFCVGEVLVNRSVGDDSITNHPERVLSMSKYFERKYPEEMRGDTYLPILFSDALIQAAAKRRTDKKSYKEYLAQAEHLNKSFRIKIKSLLVKLNLYNYLKSVSR